MVLTRSSHNPNSSPFALLDALLAGNSSRAKLIIAQDSEAAQMVGPSGFAALHAAALTEAGHRLVPTLIAAGVDVDQQIGTLDGPAAFALRQFLREHSKLPASKLCAVFRGVTPLHIASWLGHTGMVQALLQAGADTELACLEGRTALAIACYFLDCRPKRSLAIIETLLAAGADPLCPDFHGIGSLVLSPHCPKPIQTLLLDRVLKRFGGPLTLEAAAEQEIRSGGDEDVGTSASVGNAGALDSAGPSAEAEEAAAELPEPPLLDLTPEKHVDILQASLGIKHWPAFDFFLAATSADVSYPAHNVSRILSLAIIAGDVPLVLRILASGLRPDAAGCNTQGQPHVAVAAVHGHEEVVEVLCAHGSQVTLKALHHAADSRSIQGLRLLLARGRPPVLSSDAPVHIGGAHSRTGELCVMLRLLRDTAFRLRYCYRVDQPRHAADSLAMVEALADAGYRPTVYPQAVVHNGWIDLQGRLVSSYDPTVDKAAAFDLQGVNRYTWLAAKREPWTTGAHNKWPPKFKQAVQQLLMIYHAGREGSGRSGGSGSVSGSSGGGGSGSGHSMGDDVPTPRLTRAAKRARLDEMPQQKAAVAPPPPPPALPAKALYRGKAAVRRRGLAAAAAAAAANQASTSMAAAASREPGPRAAMAMLPVELLTRIIQAASYPISAWV